LPEGSGGAEVRDWLLSREGRQAGTDYGVLV